jgi:hypothetical protein
VFVAVIGRKDDLFTSHDKTLASIPGIRPDISVLCLGSSETFPGAVDLARLNKAEGRFFRWNSSLPDANKDFISNAGANARPALRCKTSPCRPATVFPQELSRACTQARRACTQARRACTQAR